MAVTIADFRQHYPEFKDPAPYRDLDIQALIWAAAGDPTKGTTGLLVEKRFRSAMDLATSLFVAHFLVVETRNRKSAQRGGTPGQVQGPLSASSASDVSKSMDTTGISLADQGQWGSTVYGQRLYQLIRMAGAGPLVVR